MHILYKSVLQYSTLTTSSWSQHQYLKFALRFVQSFMFLFITHLLSWKTSSKQVRTVWQNLKHYKKGTVLSTLPTLKCDIFQELHYSMISFQVVVGFFSEISYFSCYSCTGVKSERTKITFLKRRRFYYCPGDASDKVTKNSTGKMPVAWTTLCTSFYGLSPWEDLWMLD